MATLLLVVIYITFISLGLPDSVLGVTYPIMRNEWNLPLDYAGYVALIVTSGTIMTSIFTGTLVEKLGTGKLIMFSVLLTSIGLFGISVMPSFIWIFLFAIPLGIGAGAIDASLNNYVAQNYKAAHMNWLHAFWGIGATAGPLIMAISIANTAKWRIGYQVLAGIQFGIFFIILISLSLWKVHDETYISENKQKNQSNSKMDILRIKGVKMTLFAFVLYCAIEFSVGLWGASYLVFYESLSIPLAGQMIAIYFFGITIGRILSGIISFRLENRVLIISGVLLFIVATILLFISNEIIFIAIGFGLQGLGLAPIFPGLTHETPTRFGKENGIHLIGYQIASASFGLSVFPMIFGIIAEYISIQYYLYFLMIIALGLLFILLRLDNLFKKRF
jgi:fucose permease